MAETTRTGIAGQSILVTGGGSGIGLGTAERLAADGAHVTICGRTEQKLIDAAAQHRAGNGVAGTTVRSIVADVTVEDQIAAAVAQTAGGDGPHRRAVRLRRRLAAHGLRS